jgi:hypothetical protein
MLRGANNARTLQFAGALSWRDRLFSSRGVFWAQNAA